MKLCHQTNIFDYKIKLLQEDANNFTVVHHMQVRMHMTYDDAALEYGGCIMHALACYGMLDNGTLDNRTREELEKEDK